MASLAIAINLPAVTVTGSVYNENVLPGILNVICIGVHMQHDQTTLSTSAANLAKGNVGTIGYAYFKNLDNTNNIQIGSDGTTFQLLLKPGEFALVRWNQTNVSAKASAGAPALEYMLVEN